MTSRGPYRFERLGGVAALLLAMSVMPGCTLFRDRADAEPAPTARRESSPRPSRTSPGPRVQGIVSLYDQKPWINADVAGDRDPEGIQYRVFLNTGGNKGVAREGTFHIEMYRIGKDEKGAQTRELVSDWHYPSLQFNRIQANVMGTGYLIQLRWARKDLAGSEVEIITQFEDPDGNVARGATKRLRIPKYTS